MNGKRVFKKVFKKRVVKKYPVKSVKSVKKIVKDVIKRSAETKHCGNVPYAYVWTAANNTSASAPMSLSNALDLSQGTTDGTRIGNRVDCSKAILNLSISGNSNYPQIVEVIIFYLKGKRSIVPTASDIDSYLYQNGASATGPTNTILNMMRNTNNDFFTVVKRMFFKVGTSDSTTANYTNNDFKLFVNKKIRLPSMEGLVSYEQDNIATSHNKDLFIFCHTRSPTSATILFPVNVNFYVETEYKDY